MIYSCGHLSSSLLPHASPLCIKESLKAFRETLIKWAQAYLTTEPLLESSPDTFGLSPKSILFRTLLLLDLRRPSRSSLGSVTASPLALANKIKISVKLTTPNRWPLILAPGNALAETDGPVGVTNGAVEDGGGCGAIEMGDGGMI